MHMAVSALVLLGFLSLLYEAYGEYCDDKTYCHSPSKCCETKKGCCYDSMLHNKHFRLQVWNMWYFWFLIIFMMMSCFGGCGYYRRRRLAMLSRSPGASPAGLSPSISPSHPDGGRRNHDRRGRQFNYFAYNGPGNMGTFLLPQFHQPPIVASQPPAYSEVVSQPGLYPVNDKAELPPYPGEDKAGNSQVLPVAAGGASVWPTEDRSLPPPYTEFPGSEQPQSLQHSHPPESCDPSLSTSTPASSLAPDAVNTAQLTHAQHSSVQERTTEPHCPQVNSSSEPNLQ